MTTLVRAFCEAYLVDNQNRPLKMRPLQESIVVTALTHPTNGKQRKMAILAPRGSGKSYALSIAATVYMFFKRFRDFIINIIYIGRIYSQVIKFTGENYV